MADDISRGPQPYHIELLYENPPRIDSDALRAALEKRSGRTEAITKPDDKGLQNTILSFAHLEHMVNFKEGNIPATSVVMLGLTPQQDRMTLARQQTWDWPDAATVTSRSRASVVVGDMMSSALPQAERLRLLHNTTLAVHEIAPCIAIHWWPCQKFVEPAKFVDSKRDGADPIFPAENVRLFRIENASQGEMVMDSVGNAPFGLPDVQCHFRGLEPNMVAEVLFNAASYIFENGDVIHDRQTFGMTEEQKWICQHEVSLLEPKREVLDLNPGPPYAVGRGYQN